MPYLIDGNNLLFAFAEADRSELCRLIAHTARRGTKVCIVFDGPPPEGQPQRQITTDGLEIIYTPGRAADDIILQRIEEDSAPRRLTVVSSDRQIRRAAKARRCRSVKSDDFARQLRRREDSARQKTKQQEPPEKRQGLSPEQTRKWLDEFGFGRS